VPFLSISPYNFRNLEDKSIDLSAPEVFLVGQNGQGKTNLLEALYLAAYGNSFRTRNEAEIYKKNTNEYSVRVLFKENEYLKYLLVTGFCGGFTTFSTFSMENITLWQSGQYGILVLYLTLSIALGLSAVYLGSQLLK